MKYACLIPHCRRGYIHVPGDFKDKYPWAINDERNSHSVVWYKVFDAKSEADAIKTMAEFTNMMSTLFNRYNPHSGSYFKSYAMVLHSIDEDKSLDGDWIPGYSKGEPGYMFNGIKCSNSLLEEWDIKLE